MSQNHFQSTYRPRDPNFDRKKVFFSSKAIKTFFFQDHVEDLETAKKQIELLSFEKENFRVFFHKILLFLPFLLENSQKFNGPKPQISHPGCLSRESEL